jgi:hypothetical protein
LTAAFSTEPARETLAAPPAWLRPAELPGAAEGAEGPASGSASAELVLVFASTTEVLNAEDRLEAEGFNFRLIPVPKEINPNCGLALSFSEEVAQAVNRALAAAGLDPLAVYRRQGGAFRPAEPACFIRPAGGPEPSDASRPADGPGFEVASFLETP